jgi:hypothetical protein
MADSIDKIPLGIYKSIMSKAIRTLNQPILYVPDRISLLPPMFQPTEMYSPIHNSDYDFQLSKKILATRKFNKENKLKSKQSFMIDYLKSLND